ncbi:hypothetical protein P7C70_g2277, partial [Phenoliferia sp. Uapishka_3]
MSALTPRQACEAWVEVGATRVHQGPLVALGKGFMGGVFLSMGGLIALSIGGGDGNMTTVLGLGLNKFITAAVFPIGIIMLVLHGGDLVTGQMCILALSCYKRRTALWTYPAFLTICFIGNLAGSLWVAGLFGCELTFPNSLQLHADYLP